MQMTIRALTLLLMVAVSFAACDKDDGPAVVTPDYPPPVFRDDVNFVNATNLPAVQIDRFVEANGMDTVQTASGLVYQIDEPGGSDKPTVNSEVVVYYRGYLVNGSVFDQSPSGFPLGTQRVITPNGLIQAWKEGIPKLGRGGKMWMLARPSLAYGSNPPRGIITAETVLVFEIELIDFK